MQDTIIAINSTAAIDAGVAAGVFYVRGSRAKVLMEKSRRQGAACSRTAHGTEREGHRLKALLPIAGTEVRS